MSDSEPPVLAASTPPKRKTPFYKNWVFWFCLCLFLVIVGQADREVREGSEPDNPPKANAATRKQSKAVTERSVVGMYSGPGLYGWPCTVEVLYGGGFIQKDPGLPDGGTYIGEWTIENGQVCFYGGGSKMFSASVQDGDLVVNGRRWKKVR